MEEGKKGVKSKVRSWEFLDKLFRIGPSKCKAKDGSGRTYVIEHRVGRAIAAYRFAELMARTGLEKEWSKQAMGLERRLTNPADISETIDALYNSKKRKLYSMIKNFRTSLNKMYKDQGIRPVMNFVKVDDETTALFIQGFIDEGKRPVVGDIGDVAAWAEATYARTKAIRELNEDARLVAREIIKLPNVNRDIKERMELVTKGKVEFNIGFLPVKPHA